MPSDQFPTAAELGLDKEELIRRIAEAKANPAAMPVGQYMKQATPPDVLGMVGHPMGPDNLIFWGDMVKATEILEDENGNKKDGSTEEYGMLYLSTRNNLGRYWINLEMCDKLIEFLTLMRQELSPVEVVSNKLIVPGR